MTNPMPIGDNAPGYAPGANPGGGEPAQPAPYTPYTPYGEQAPQPGGEPTPAFGAPPPQYPPYPPQYQPYQQQYQPGAAPPYPGYPPQYVPGMNPTNALAIASFVCSLVGVVVAGLGIVGIILGHIALGQIKRSNGYERGHGYAVAGLIIGYAEVAIGLIIAILFFSLILIVPATIPTN
ncbi:MAG TPA: DUF4190 domain-containing protein [Ktedonobacterales bacterium]|nr:DUF4190 domain-containing protein [Ktedonobacterales bacterium]